MPITHVVGISMWINTDLDCPGYLHHVGHATIISLAPSLLFSFSGSLVERAWSYYFATKHFVADTKFPGVVELTTQLLILENILWLPLCRINKFGLNTLPSKTVVIPYTCGLSGAHE